MGTVRDRNELGAALRAHAIEIEVRGALARELGKARLAARLAVLSGVGALALGGVMAGLGAMQGAQAQMGPRGVVGMVLAGLVLLGALLVALRSAGPAAFGMLRRYREVHRSQGVLVLRRKP